MFSFESRVCRQARKQKETFFPSLLIPHQDLFMHPTTKYHHISLMQKITRGTCPIIWASTNCRKDQDIEKNSLITFKDPCRSQ